MLIFRMYVFYNPVCIACKIINIKSKVRAKRIQSKPQVLFFIYQISTLLFGARYNESVGFMLKAV